MNLASPFALAARQRELDRALTARFPVLYARKQQRLLASPHAFLRGSSPLFYELLAARPDLAAGPAGVGWIAGDMHLENVGAFPVDKGRTVFDLNDFDDATIGPLQLDVLRLGTSVLLAARTCGAGGPGAIALAERMVASYCRGFHGDAAPPAPPRIVEMLGRAAGRTQHLLLDGRAPKGRDGKRRFDRGERYLDLPADLAAQVPGLLRAYVDALGAEAPARASTWEVSDAAQRVAGTGSLGVLRIAVLIVDSDGDERILELKEEHRSSTEALLPVAPGRWASPGQRVVAAARAMLSEPPRQLAAVEGGPAGQVSFAVRKLFPQEDKLAIDEQKAGPKLDALVQTIGYLLGKAHARGVKERSPAPWSPAEIGGLVDRSIELASLFEGIYLAYARDRRDASERE